MNSKDGARFVAVAAVIGFAVGASWTHMRARDTESSGLSLGDHDVAFQPGPAPEQRLPQPASSPTRLALAIEPLSPDVLMRRVADVFPAGYLTIIAIIQGVALGAAIVTSQQQLLGQRGIIDDLIVEVQALGVFAAIVIITHRYFVLTVNSRWTPTIFDTLIPYALGVGEISTALLIGRNTAWWTAVSVVFLIAVGAFAHTYIRQSRTPLPGSFRESLASRIFWCGSLLAYSTAVTILSANNIGPRWLYVIFPSTVTIGAIAVAFIGERSQNRLYDAYGIPRWRPRSSRSERGIGARIPEPSRLDSSIHG